MDQKKGISGETDDIQVWARSLEKGTIPMLIYWFGSIFV